MKRQQATDYAFMSGTIIGDYRLEHLAGWGNNAEVWFATKTDDGKMVALKVMDADAASSYYDSASKIGHPNILRPMAMFSHDDKGVVVMPACEGRSVELLAGSLSERQAWQLLNDIASALAAMHAKDLAHGNVCAENILWDGERFLLTGFSSARLVADGGRPADDIWQLGATIFYLCMGCHVFNGMGMKSQRPSSPLPYMRKSMPRLSETVQHCLTYDGRLTAEEVAGMTKKGLSTCGGGDRQHKPVSATARRLKANFWPDEMRRVVMAIALVLCCLALPAQTISDKELSKLVNIVIDLRKAPTADTYERIKTIMLNDSLWTPMSELGSLRDEECPFSDKRLKSFKFNSILNTVDRLRKPVTTHGDGLNGEDIRYNYSLYERSAKAGKTVSYEMKGRVGAQTFVIVPFNGVAAAITAKVEIGDATIEFKESKTLGVLVANYEGDLIKTDHFTIYVKNGSSEGQAFVVINHNTRKL